MKYVVETAKSPAQAVADLEAAVKRHNFGVLHNYNLKQTLASKGIDLPHECHILEVCNPNQAATVLEEDMEMNLALPCRVSVYQENGRTRIGMIRPTALLSFLSESPRLKTVAQQVESAMVRMIDEAR
jgi:uncharacterized protein (DUF302 family)